MFNKSIWIAGIVMLALGAGSAMAKVSADEAARLGKDLTPWGAERAGNTDGTIPAWTGGVKPPADWQAGGHRPDPYAADKVEFTITAANYQQYADKLTHGLKTFFEKYPETFKMNIYPSRRGHDLPDWVKKNIAKNATSAELADDGNGIVNVYGGTPFPLPQNGSEVIWNHLTAYQGQSKIITCAERMVLPNGSMNLDASSTINLQYNFYQHGDALVPADEVLSKFAYTAITPASEAGYGILYYDYVNAAKNPRKGWLYSPGERRVRRAPSLGFDSPDRSITTYDDFFVYMGSPERYDWKLIGKQEMYIPYNSYKLTSSDSPLDDITTANHLNPEYVRYELHRVWVVEATVKEGKRHKYAKRVFYIDEDSWQAAAVDKYDKGGELWRISYGFQKTYYDAQSTHWAVTLDKDFKNGMYNAYGFTNGFATDVNIRKEPLKESIFTPAALRRSGRR